MGKIFVNELFRNLYLNDREFVREERLHIIPDSLQPRHGYEGGSCSSIPAHHIFLLGMNTCVILAYLLIHIHRLGMNV